VDLDKENKKGAGVTRNVSRTNSFTRNNKGSGNFHEEERKTRPFPLELLPQKDIKNREKEN
jgi:hypothetical protein